MAAKRDEQQHTGGGGVGSSFRRVALPFGLVIAVSIFFLFYAEEKEEVTPENVVSKPLPNETTGLYHHPVEEWTQKTATEREAVPFPEDAEGGALTDQGPEADLSNNAAPAMEWTETDATETDATGSNGIYTGAVSPPVVTLGSDLSKIDNMFSNFKASREKMIRKLKVDYGDRYYVDIFTTPDSNGETSIVRELFQTPGGSGPSWHRLKRKLMIKLLKVQLAAASAQSSFSSYSSSSADADAKFVWASGGHSSAAGHGNLYRESYTAVMERTARDVFASVGIDFIGRNYAMGSSRSAPEMALCLDEVYGKDIDALSWDHGMLEGRFSHHMQTYFYRAGLHANRPVCVGMLGSDMRSRIDAAAALERIGLTTFLMADKVRKDAESRVPDTQQMTDEQIEELPEFVRNLRCGPKLEKGDPYCSNKKWNRTICENRPFKTSWHMGWKLHALYGNFMAVFMVELLSDALTDIMNKGNMEPRVLLDELKQLEDTDYSLFRESALPSIMAEYWQDFFKDVDVSVDVLFKSPTYCHIATIPAEIRFKGILTETNDKVGFDNFERGLGRKEVDKRQFSEYDADPTMILISDERKGEESCPVPVHVDHKDFFYVSSQMGWRQVRIPNDAEVKEYGTGKPTLGFVAGCLAKCDLACPKDMIYKAEDFQKERVEMQVNGQTVTKYTVFGINRCILLRNELGAHWEPDAEGKYTIRARAQPNKALRFSTFIVW